MISRTTFMILIIFNWELEIEYFFKIVTQSCVMITYFETVKDFTIHKRFYEYIKIRIIKISYSLIIRLACDTVLEKCIHFIFVF